MTDIDTTFDTTNSQVNRTIDETVGTSTDLAQQLEVMVLVDNGHSLDQPQSDSLSSSLCDQLTDIEDTIQKLTMKGKAWRDQSTLYLNIVYVCTVYINVCCACR